MTHRRVLVVGSGFSGIAMGARLLAEGIEDFLVLERGADVGGTWRDNRYPGCACDVPSSLYSLSFAPTRAWSRAYAPAGEIWNYLRDCVTGLGLAGRIVLGADVVEAVWSGDRWRVRVADGREWTAGALVLGVGGLSIPARPDLPGLGTFAGPVLHTADWPEHDGLDGMRVAVVGTGASAAQVIPALAPRVARLVVLQRSAAWVVPRGDRPSMSQHGERHLPAGRWRTYARLETRLLGFGRAAPLRAAVERQALARLAEAVPDRETRAKLTPTDALGCKRVIVSDDYWPTFAKDHVWLETSPVAQVEPRALLTVDGGRHEIDALVLATGFEVFAGSDRLQVTGLGGRTLAQAWARRRSAHLGITVAGFPELYLLLGPNTALGHSSVVLMIEAAVEHVLAALRRADRQGPHTVTEQAQRRFERWVDARTRHTVWGSGCRSWYLDKQGRNVTLWPASTVRYRLATRRPRPADFEPVPPA